MKLITDENSYAQGNPLPCFVLFFSSITDKYAAWSKLDYLTADDDIDVRWIATTVLGSIYSDVPDSFEEEAWNSLLRLVVNESFLEQINKVEEKRTSYCFSMVMEK
ncbi:hypothetical protein [Methanolobus psychrotolerans]|uniref:hypothetical protein n=1 Tax=Methanolobus psychrotolerans TaxID=1874706 RepID=UPI000B91C053|nr:hypothetical protein [Methanolobus psychrotolerans]